MVMQGRYFTSMLKKGNLAVHACGEIRNFSSGVEIVYNTNNKLFRISKRPCSVLFKVQAPMKYQTISM